MAETVSITICGDGGCAIELENRSYSDFDLNQELALYENENCAAIFRYPLLTVACDYGYIGKSSITLRLVRSQWTHEYDPTIGTPSIFPCLLHTSCQDSYSVTRTVDGLPYFLALTDTAGQEEYRGLWASSNLKSDAFLMVYDITNASSLEALDYFMDMIDIEAEQRLETNARLFRDVGPSSSSGDQVAVGMAPPVKIIAGNKCDLKDERVIGARQGLEYARKRGCGFMETSAREMVNIEETFGLIVRRVVEARRLHHLKQFPPHLQKPGHSSLAAHSLSQNLFSPDILVASQADSHSRTPALTAKERKITNPKLMAGPAKSYLESLPEEKDGDTADKNHGVTSANTKREEAVSEKKGDGATKVVGTDRHGNDESERTQPWWRRLFCWAF
ncbi:hypothetical protein AJ79_04191 [Helicocarpus griseus UAMH5409]|uniref:Small monomeric GTPase n=1 Tax=Helicocarpus griseus UAMH5409 TaxID=1447875 RepID=A0A2B7XU97_9EURO|nr:hypothetical protein AJ79_04191 [Helicocarpus griseus UAMH5409]